MAHLFVIAGHGAGDPGACAHGASEAERVRALAMRIKHYGGESVTLGDLGRNYYADNGISGLRIPKNWQILELHMDSAGAGARGGHVIINSGFTSDRYDKALADNISRIFPGRSKTIVARGDLANPRRAAAMGYGYRLLEVCFISNKQDLDKFNSSIDDVAKTILGSFDISVNNVQARKTEVDMTPQELLNASIKKKHGGGAFTLADMLAWIEFNTADTYAKTNTTASAAKDGTAGKPLDRISFIDQRVRLLYDRRIPEIEKRLDTIIAMLDKDR